MSASTDLWEPRRSNPRGHPISEKNTDPCRNWRLRQGIGKGLRLPGNRRNTGFRPLDADIEQNTMMLLTDEIQWK